VAQLPDVIKVLLDPGVYPEPPENIELVQTQMSFVILAGDMVYKVKKPVNLGFLDYTTLERRRYYCQQEVSLNRRLCPDAYLGVVPITSQAGNIQLDGKGDAIEYAVKMRHLPADAMLDSLLVRKQASPEMLTSVAVRLAEFHRSAETGDRISAFGGLDTVNQNTGENFVQTEKYIGTAISPGQYRRIKDYTEGFMRDNASLFQKRVADGRIRDCHGDLHAAHICFNDGICIYDCIEFNDRFRYCDVAAEVAFLAMDLDRYRRADLSRHFVDAYVAHSHDEELVRLLHFYKCYRAYVRGKVACFKFDDPYVSPAERDTILSEARGYFALAESYAGKESAH